MIKKIISLPKPILIIAVASIIGIVLLITSQIFKPRKQISNNTKTVESNFIIPQEKNEVSSLSELLRETPQENGKSPLSEILDSKKNGEETPKERKQNPVDLYYTIEPGETTSIAHFYISSILTPVQGVQMVVDYPNNITPLSVEPAPRFPDLIKTTINQENKTIFAMASVGQNGQSVTGAYPIFSIVFEGQNPSFNIQSEKTIVAASGQAIEFNIISE